MLVRYYVVFILWVYGLVMWRDIDLVVGELVPAKIFEEIGVPWRMEVQRGVGGVF
jgi:hypothetical protein